MNPWEYIVIPAALSIIRGSVKNPAHKAALKHYMLEIRDAITAAYADDPDFTAAATK